MTDVRTVLASKGRNVHTISKTNTVFEAVCKMVQYNVGALPVIEHSRVIGIITERDYLRKIAVEGRSSKTTFVQEVMTPNPVCVTPDTPAPECMQLMTKHRIRHLPVIVRDELYGTLSVRDLVDHLTLEQQQTINELTHYIQGTYT
ncbi:MAG TPA: CBS domain-containing protein [Polyangiaceae bacterium]|jgi:CBS domain-containing protein|nr:CBS domain-containing protein [Polyangiaceae bacterium]